MPILSYISHDELMKYYLFGNFKITFSSFLESEFRIICLDSNHLKNIKSCLSAFLKCQFIINDSILNLALGMNHEKRFILKF